MRFPARIEATGKTAAGVRVSVSVVDGLRAGKRPAVRVTRNGYTYRSTIAVIGGEYWLGVSTANWQAAGVTAGDQLDIDLELDVEPREVKEAAVEFRRAAALTRNVGERALLLERAAASLPWADELR